MTGLDVFALIVLLVLVAAGIAVWVILGMLPGRIARSRHHPQTDAINMCGWWGAVTMGLLSPVAYIWAYTKPIDKPVEIDVLEVDSSKQAQMETKS